MWQNITEIDEVFTKHNYNTNNIINSTFHQFKLKIAFKRYGFEKEQGFSVQQIVFVLLFLPFLGAKSVHQAYKKNIENFTIMQKDVLYRFLNNPDIDWRRILLFVAKQFDILTGTRKSKEISEFSAAIIDDTGLFKTGRTIEKVSYVHDHVLGKTLLGFKNLVLSHFDGISYKVVDYSLHAEKELTKKDRKKQFQSNLSKTSPSSKRLKECDKDKITVAIEMLKRAAKNGFKFNYVLVDSWFTSLKFIKEVRNIAQHKVHVISAIKKDKRKYGFCGELLNANQLLAKLKKELGHGSGKRNRKNNIRYYEIIVDYQEVGPVRLFFAKSSHQRNWRLFISTDTTIKFNRFVEIYSIRWGIEIIFKECKSYLKLGKCQARSISSQIANIALCFILYNMLVYQKLVGNYSTVGGLFEHLADDFKVKTISEKLWDIFKELLELIIDHICLEYGPIKSYQDFLKSKMFNYIQDKFINSFISPFIATA